MINNRILFSLLMLHTIPAFSAIDNYIFPNSSPSYSNYGTIGLLQMPSARFHKEGTVAFNWVNNKPYQQGSVLAYPFDWLEASFQYADINNALYSDVESFSGKQTYKDKGFSLSLIHI